MNISNLSNTITVQTSPFYKCEELRPFIDAYFHNPNLVGGDERFVLFQRYLFGDSDHYLRYCDSLEEVRHSDLFIGYRYVLNSFHPFFLSLNELTENGKRKFEITGYSTFMEDDYIRPYYQKFKKFKPFVNFDFELILKKDSSSPWEDNTNNLGLEKPLYLNILEMSKITFERIKPNRIKS